MITIDKRLELLEALVVAVKLSNVDDLELNNELDFVEYYDIPYVKELVKKINIEKYSEVIDYIKDIEDCGYYTNLFLFFDDNFNINHNFKINPFRKKNCLEFAKIVKNIYDNEKIKDIFKKYRDYLIKLENDFRYNFKIDFKENLSKMYGMINNINFSTNISLLINGGFSAISDNHVAYVRGIKLKENNSEIELNEYTIVCMFHEYSHYFVNKIIDKYFDKINNLDFLYDESLKNGLPKTYRNKKTLLYEYFVRANSLLLSEKLISKDEFNEDIEWFKELGFVRISEIIEIIRSGLYQDLKFEEIFKTLIFDYFNNIKKFN